MRKMLIAIKCRRCERLIEEWIRCALASVVFILKQPWLLGVIQNRLNTKQKKVCCKIITFVEKTVRIGNEVIALFALQVFTKSMRRLTVKSYFCCEH